MRLIDADALIEKCGEWYTEEGTEEGFIGTVKSLVDAQPTIEPERKTGRWIFPYTDKRYKKCSECGREYYSIPATSNYCPNCGAKMEVEYD